MPFNGSGTFQRVMNWVNDATAGIKIRADRHDQEDDNFAAGLSQVITKDGQTQPTANIPLAGFRLINVGDPVGDQDAVTKKWTDLNIVGGAKIADTPPTALPGNLWWESDTGNLFLRYDDGSSVQWVQVNVAGGPPSSIAMGGAVDMFAGFKTSARFVVNDKVGGDGTDVFIVRDTGIVTFTGTAYIENANPVVVVDKTASGNYGGIQGRTAGNLRWLIQLGTAAAEGGANAGSDFAITSYNDAGANLNTPLQISRQQNQITLAPTRFNDLVGNSINWHAKACAAVIDYAGPAANYGLQLCNRNVSGPSSAVIFGWSSAVAGSIVVNNSTTTVYNTTSDERLKDFGAEMTGDEAAAIIRADPVRHFTWKETGEAAVGWGAQTSYEVSHDLATPPTELPAGRAAAEPGDPDFMPWGMDQSRRTPYLWAALAAALDKIDALEARITELEEAR